MPVSVTTGAVSGNHDLIIHVLLTPFFHIGEKTKMYFLNDITNMLSEKKVSKKSPSKMNISSVLEQIGLLSRGKKVSICSQGEALGGIAERPLTTRISIISGVAGHQRCSAAAYDGESWGSGGIAPGSTGAGLKVLLGVGKAHGFV